MKVPQGAKEGLWCPECGEDWLLGWTGRDLKEYLEGGMARKDVEINKAQCTKCGMICAPSVIIALLKVA